MSNKNFDPVLISLIRNAMPSIIADEICSAQPMTSPFNKEEWPYQVDALYVASFTDVIPMTRWCRETLKQDEWTSKSQFFAFKNEEALNWFTLRWL